MNKYNLYKNTKIHLHNKGSWGKKTEELSRDSTHVPGTGENNTETLL